MRSRFRPPAWAWCLTAAGFALFASLAHWQWDRGRAKDRLAESLAQRTPVTLDARAPAPADLDWRHAAAHGRYDGRRSLLHEGQSHNGTAGFHVWTPFQLADGSLVIVNRGWRPTPSADPPPGGDVAITGLWRSLPRPGLRFGDPAPCAAPSQFPVRVLYPERQRLECLLGQAVLPGLLLLDPGLPGGYVREWPVPGLPPERHYGYAVQWGALALTALILFLVTNLRRP